jgi:acetyltransferase
MPAASSPLDAVFRPRSIAVIGADPRPDKLGYVLVDNLQRAQYQGQLFAVNPLRQDVLGVACAGSVDELEDAPELAVVVVPRDAVRGVLEACGRKGVPAAVVITAGFRETGAEGAAAEAELLALARRYGMRLVGPNTVGVINTAIGMNATFAEAAPSRFGVSMFSQSGAVATAVLDWANSMNMGFAKFVSLGNMADVSDVDVLEYFTADDDTQLIVGYLEGISDGRRFLDVARRATARKPAVVMKVGSTQSGVRAARSHTGALASADAVVSGAFRQAGVIRARTMAGLFDITLCFAFAPLPEGRRVAVVTNAGGPGVMAADAIEERGLQLAQLSAETLRNLGGELPQAAAIGNPVDVLGDAGAGRYRAALGSVMADRAVDAVIVLLTPQRMTEPDVIAGVIKAAAKERSKPVLAVLMGGAAVQHARELLDEARVPVYAYPERGVAALAALTDYAMQLKDRR